MPWYRYTFIFILFLYILLIFIVEIRNSVLSPRCFCLECFSMTILTRAANLPNSLKSTSPALPCFSLSGPVSFSHSQCERAATSFFILLLFKSHFKPGCCRRRHRLLWIFIKIFAVSSFCHCTKANMPHRNESLKCSLLSAAAAEKHSALLFDPEGGTARAASNFPP